MGSLGFLSPTRPQPLAYPAQNGESWWQLRDVKGDSQGGSSGDTRLTVTGASSSVAPGSFSQG